MTHNTKDQEQKTKRTAQTSSKSSFVSVIYSCFVILGEVIRACFKPSIAANTVLIDVSRDAKIASKLNRNDTFFGSVALTPAAWVDCVEWTEETTKRKQMFEPEDLRLWDVLYFCECAVSKAIRLGRDVSKVYVALDRIPAVGRGVVSRPVFVVVECTVGDSGEMSVTIMMPHESYKKPKKN